MNNMFCTNCGQDVPTNSKFCTKCGNKFEHQASTATAQVSTGIKSLKGLKGWLVLVCLGLIFTVITSVIAVFETSQYFLDGTIEQLSYIQGFAGALGFELIANIIMVFVGIYLLYLYGKEKNRFPKLYIAYLVILVAVALIDVVILDSLDYPLEVLQEMQPIIDEGYTALVRAVGSGLIWGLYMKVSKRVRATFVN